MDDKIKKYYEKLNEIKLLDGISNLLDWDQQNKMPAKSTQARANKMALISKIHHQYITSNEFVKLVKDLYDNQDTLDPIDKRSIEVTKKQVDQLTKLPTDFVEEMSRTNSMAHNSWVEAKKKEDFDIFKKSLEKIIELTKKKADYIDPHKPPYDVLLDEFEEDMTTKDLDGVFNTLVVEFPALLKAIPRTESRSSLTGRDFDRASTERFLEDMVKQIGFDMERGALGDVPHPFETTISEHDVRLNMKYPEKDISYTIMSAVHELGHGLYEQYIDKKYYHTHLNHGVSLGIHESQSRLLENIVGRSREFWEHFLPVLQKYLPQQMESVTVDDVINDLNMVEASFIRTEADEVTYNIHILLRYQLETDLLSDSIIVDELPEAWNAKMKQLLDIVPEKPSLGVLQDVHWSMGNIAYFPTYTLGNLNAAQLWNKFEQDHPQWRKKISQGDFTEYFNWFKEHIWQHGSFYRPQELMKNITGQSTNAQYLVDYLKKKYLPDRS